MEYEPTSTEKIWLQKAQEKKATHVIVVLDTFEKELYPVYVLRNENCDEMIKAYNDQPGQVVQKALEVK